MKGANIVFSAHARSRMAQRSISEKQVQTILGGGTCIPEPDAPAARGRWRYSGRVDGRLVTIIVAREKDALIVVTAY